jgi:hypothetical protein
VDFEEIESDTSSLMSLRRSCGRKGERTSISVFIFLRFYFYLDNINPLKVSHLI